ncbi:MAG TPA: hypothetical protein PLA19_03995 [Candidatus Pacearchaeota archaeon]|nr:hypothetical protein [Candidatus Pacearchaeota archaeon]
MKNKLGRKNIVAAAVMVFCAAVAVWGGAAYADEIAAKENPMNGLAAAIASKFNLSESAVQAVFDEQMRARREKMEANRKEMETKRQEQFEDRLSKLVAEGKLTEAQAAAIKKKKTETETQMTTQSGAKFDFKSMTVEERKAAMAAQRSKMEAERAALKKWAADNGIPEEYASLAGMTGSGHGRGGGLGGPGLGGQGPCSE